MPLEISQVTDPSDFQKIMPMDYDAWQTPYNPQLKHFRPNLPTRAESVAYTTAKYVKKLTENDPSHFFIKLTDTDTDEIVGFAIWEINQMDGQGDAGTEPCWHPVGSEEREFAACFIDGLWAFLAARVQRKHMGWFAVILSQSFPHQYSVLKSSQIFSPSSFTPPTVIAVQDAC